jgi:hypothetical protein
MDDLTALENFLTDKDAQDTAVRIYRKISSRDGYATHSARKSSARAAMIREYPVIETVFNTSGLKSGHDFSDEIVSACRSFISRLGGRNASRAQMFKKAGIRMMFL